MNLFILNCEIILFIFIFISNINPSELIDVKGCSSWNLKFLNPEENLIISELLTASSTACSWLVPL